MKGVRVQGIDPQCPEKIVWQYFTNVCGSGVISDVYYPVLNNDAIVIFKNVSAATKVLSSRHDKWNVLPLPNQVFSKQRVWLEKDLTEFLQDQEHHQGVLRDQAQVEISMESATRQMMLTGQPYQIEWAWRYLSNLQDQVEHMSGVFHSAAMNAAPTSPSIPNGNIVTNGDMAHTSRRDKSHAGHFSLTSPGTHNLPRHQNRDVFASDVRSLAVEGVTGSGRRLPTPAVGLEMSRPTQVDPSITSLAIEGLSKVRADSSPGTGTVEGSGTVSVQRERSPGSSKPKMPPIKVSYKDDGDVSQTGLAAAVVEDSEQGDHMTSLNSRAGWHVSPEHGVSTYTSLPVSKSGTTRGPPNPSDAVAQNSGRKSQGSSSRTVCESSPLETAEAKHRASRQHHSMNHLTASTPYDCDDVYGAVGGAEPQSLWLGHDQDVDFDSVESRGAYSGHRAFSSLPYNNTSSFGLPSNTRLALLNRSIVELSRKHFEVGHRLKLKIYVDDITRTRTDAVVNAANWELKNVGGVAGALAKAAGPEMERDCMIIYRERGALKTAQVVKTKAYGKLSHLKYVFHTVGPIFRKENSDKCVFELAQTFLNCLLFAEKLNLESVTFPFISTGIFGMPVEHCVLALFTAVFKYAYERNSNLSTLEEVHFINNDMDSVCNAVLHAEMMSKRENMDTSVKRMLEGEKLYGGSVYPFCDQNDRPKTKSKTRSSSPATSSSSADDRYGTWDSSRSDAGATAAADDNDNDGRRSQHHSRARASRQDMFAAGSQSVSAIDPRSSASKSRSGLVDRESRTVAAGSVSSSSKSSSGSKGRDSSPMPRPRSRSSSMTSADRGSSSGSTTKQGGGTASGSSSVTQRTQPVIKQSIVPSASTGKKRSVSLAKSVAKGRTADQSSGNDTDASSTAPSETEEPPDRMCPICLEDPMKQPKRLPCRHQFCTPCADRAMELNPRCPKCQRLFGIPTGTQPSSGSMTYTVDYTLHLPGHAGCGTITITYNFSPGVQEACHPNPGQYYEGTHRVAYLPASAEGREVLKMLQKAFDHRLVFTIGDSVTTGRRGVITWNDIHHKTSTYGGPVAFGYPDTDYLYRVREELASKGITHP